MLHQGSFFIRLIIFFQISPGFDLLDFVATLYSLTMVLGFFWIHTVIIMASLLFKRSLAKPLGIGLISHSLLVNSSTRKSRCDGVLKASASTLAFSENPLLKKEGTPLFREIKSEHVVPALEHDLSELKRDFKGNAVLISLCCFKYQ